METTNSPIAKMANGIPLASRFASYLTMIRLPNCLMIGVAVIVGETIALGRAPPLREATLGFLTPFLLLAGTMVLNDIHDIQVDRINSPERPLPSGKVTVNQAYTLSIALSLLAMTSSLFLGAWTFLTALAALILMAFYNTRGKKMGLLGNGVVSFNVALPFLFGGLAVNSLRPLLYTFFLLAFLANMAREVAKGMTDVAGDSAKGIKTIAATKGLKSASQVAAGLFIIAVLLSIVPPKIDQSVSLFYYPGVILADFGFLYASYRLLRDQSPNSVRSVKTQVLFWMLLGLVGFVMGGSTAF